MVLVAIIACEIGFWLAILAGLLVRYAAGRARLGAALLFLAPVIDAILLAFVAIDLLGGGSAEWAHGLAALYIGISIAYGHQMIAWADAVFARWLRGVPRPPKLFGRDYAVRCWKDVGRTTLAAAVAAAILQGLVVLVGDPAHGSAVPVPPRARAAGRDRDRLGRQLLHLAQEAPRDSLSGEGLNPCRA